MMKKNAWIIIVSIIVIAVLSVAVYQAMILAGQRQGDPNGQILPRAANGDNQPGPVLVTATQPPTQAPAARASTNTPGVEASPMPGPTATFQQPTRAPVIVKGWNGRPDIILATQQPVREPDLDYQEVIEVKDQSIFVKPLVKGESSQALAQTEVVSTNTTEIYCDQTNWDVLTQEGMVQRVVIPYSVEQIKVRDTLFIWGYQRGDRLVAELILVYPER